MDFEILVLNGAYPSSVAMSRDLLDAAVALAPRYGAAAPRWRLCSLHGGRVALRGGLSVETEPWTTPRGDHRTICVIPGLGATDPHVLLAQMQAPECATLAPLLAAHLAGGGMLAASCSAVFLLHAAGVLDGRRATTTWWLAPTLARVAPRCRIDADRMVCADGPVITAGAAFAHADLLLHLLRERCGPKLSAAVSRWLLVEQRHAQAPFVIPEVLASGHTLVVKLTERIESTLPAVPSATELARTLCVSERTLARHVRSATGKSTGSLVQSIRLRRARELLAHSRMTIEQVAIAVGYQDATALRRLIRRGTGSSPSQFRAAVTVS